MQAAISLPDIVTSAVGAMRQGSAMRWIICMLFSCSVLCAGVAGLLVGAVDLSLASILTKADADLERMILTEIRGPRVLLAGCTGAALAVAGAALQGLFRNPLAEPSLIGVSSGAALGAIAIIVLGPSLAIPAILEPYALPLAAVAGASLVTLFLYGFSVRYGQFGIVTILLVGIAINALAAVGIGIFQYVSDDASLRTLTFWMMGSFGRATWQTLLPALMLMTAGIVPIFYLVRSLDVLQLGEAEAFHLGIDVNRVKRSVILCSAATVGAGVALTGIVGFIGLVVPHLVRLLLGASHVYVIPASALLGATLTMLADLLARVLFAPAELPVSLITSALGAPFFLWLIARARPR